MRSDALWDSLNESLTLMRRGERQGHPHCLGGGVLFGFCPTYRVRGRPSRCSHVAYGSPGAPIALSRRFEKAQPTCCGEACRAGAFSSPLHSASGLQRAWTACHGRAHAAAHVKGGAGLPGAHLPGSGARGNAVLGPCPRQKWPGPPRIRLRGGWSPLRPARLRTCEVGVSWMISRLAA